MMFVYRSQSILLALAFFAFFSYRSFSQSTSSKESLKEIGPIEVMVEKIEERHVLEAGINNEEIKALVEMKLRQNGIPIANFNPDNPFLYININFAYIQEIQTFYWSNTIELIQPVKVLKNGMPLIAPTWQKGSLSEARRSVLSQTVKEHLEIYLNIFVNDYLAANQKTE